MRRPTIRSMDDFLPADVRRTLEERFWQPVEQQSAVEAFARDRTLLSATSAHPALWSDHGVMHARDVAAGTLELADIVNGCLLPARPADRQEFVMALAVLISYIHDIGMNDATPDGRRVHAIYAAQIPFSGAMDDVIAQLWGGDGPVAARIRAVGAVDPFRTPGDVVLRELAALAIAHSKSMVPAAVYADFPRLRRLLQQAVLVELEEHRRNGVRLDSDADLPDALGAARRWYADPVADAFSWLNSPDPAQRALAIDAIDALRLVRVADALRQRGSALRTAAGYEIFIDAATGHAVFSLRTSAGDRMFLLRFHSPLSAGEANVRTAELTSQGDLRISFHRGRFSSAAAAAAVAGDATARVVADIGADVLGAFAVRAPSPELPPPTCDLAAMRIELERPTDEPAFAENVADAAARIDPQLSGRISVVADLENAAPAERIRYLRGIPIAAESDQASEILRDLGTRGMRIDLIDRTRAFEDVRLVVVVEGERIVDAGSPPAFVYVAIGCRLRIEQPGGYQVIEVPPGIPIGVTGVVRRAERSSTVVAAGSGDVVMIPGELFAREWFHPYEPAELADVLAADEPERT